MNETTACPLRETISLSEALRRFQVEAIPGVCDTGRYRCSYYSWGQGPTLICIPGMSDDARSFIMLCAHLARDFRCIAYDLPAGDGDGASLQRYRHGHLVEDGRALLDHLSIKQSYLLGSSFGATIALAALGKYPDRFKGAVLQGGFARRPLAPAEVLLAGLARYWPGTMKSLPFRDKILFQTHHEPFARLPPEIWDYFLSRWNSLPKAAVARRAWLVHRLDLRPILRFLDQPILLVSGERDPLVNGACEEELLRGLPQACRVELDGCGHNPLFTHPEVLADVVKRFLRSSPCGSLFAPGGTL